MRGWLFAPRSSRGGSVARRRLGRSGMHACSRNRSVPTARRPNVPNCATFPLPSAVVTSSASVPCCACGASAAVVRDAQATTNSALPRNVSAVFDSAAPRNSATSAPSRPFRASVRMAHPKGVLPSLPCRTSMLSDRLRRRFPRHRNRVRCVLRWLLRLRPNRLRPPESLTSSPSSTCCSDPRPWQRCPNLQGSTCSAYHLQAPVGVVLD